MRVVFLQLDNNKKIRMLVLDKHYMIYYGPNILLVLFLMDSIFF